MVNNQFGYPANSKSKYKLTLEDEISLYKRIKKGDEKAREELILANRGLVYMIANVYFRRVEPFSSIQHNDLVSEGQIGLMKAVERYDPKKCIKGRGKFSTYARWWIEQRIRRHVDNNFGGDVRLPLHRKSEVYKISKIIANYQAVKGRPSSNEEIAAKLNKEKGATAYTAKIVANITNTSNIETISFDSFINDDGEFVFGNSIVFEDKSAKTPEDYASSRNKVELIKELMNKLTDRERTVLECRFGFKNKKAMTLEEISHIYDVTRERIRQIEFKALRKMRRYVSKIGKNGNGSSNAQEAFS